VASDPGLVNAEKLPLTIKASKENLNIVMAFEPLEASLELKEAWKAVQPLSCEFLESIFKAFMSSHYPNESAIFDYDHNLRLWTPKEWDNFSAI
jgi:hypothetical protein